MGIDIRLDSPENPDWIHSLGRNRYCEYAWQDIDWSSIFEHINFNLTILYDNTPNYWTTEQLEVVNSNMKKLLENPRYYAEMISYGDEDVGVNLEEIKSLSSDIQNLISLFEIYIENKARIVIY